MKITKRYRLLGGIAVPVLSLAIFALAILPTIRPAKALGQIYTVTNTGDNNGTNPAPGANTGTLRQAIVDANANMTATSASPNQIQFNIPGTGVQTIALQSALPQITQPTIIDGTTQPGSSCGVLVDQNPDGTIKPTNTQHVLTIEITSRSIVSGVDTLSIGSTATGSIVEGLVINGVQDANKSNLFIAAPNVSLQCNYVGTSADGLTALSTKGVAGMFFAGSASGATVQNNLVSGNGFSGISILDGNSNSKVYKNLIGTNPDGTSAVPNKQPSSGWGFGVRMRSTTGTDVFKNIISGNELGICGSTGMAQGCTSNTNLKVRGNYIGVDITGMKALANGMGARIDGPSLLVGGSTPDDRNIISGNLNDGIWVQEAGSGVTVTGNYIGVGKDGKTVIGNAGTGIRFSFYSGTNNTLGGPSPSLGNVIGGNSWHGVWFGNGGNCSGMTAKGNYIGVSPGGDPIPNGKSGINISCDNSLIGGPGAQDGNKIAYNLQDGIQVTGGAKGSRILNNSIYSNGIIGIDLDMNMWNAVPDGPTPNDPLDPDTGPNNLQNYPVITASMTKCDGTTDTKNTPMFNSTPNTTFTIDYYANPSWNPNGTAPRQGEQWVSSETVTTDANGNADLNLTLINSITYPSVTATDPQGSTSEFGSINTMAFTQCQDMLQRVVATTTKDFNIGATWTGFSIPNTYYSNWPTWDGTQYVDNIQKSGLTFKVTVGGQDFIPTEPLTQWNNAYNLDNGNWNANGHTATPLPEGTYDVVLTLTDPLSGLSMTKTYKDAVKVALPKVNYTTTFTNNSTPTLTGTASGVNQWTNGLYSAYILPKGSPAPDPNLAPTDPSYATPRLLQYVPDAKKDANGNILEYLDTGSFKVMTNKQAIIDAWTADHDLQLANWAQGGSHAWSYFFSFADQFSNISGVDWTQVKSLTDMQSTCTNTDVQQRIAAWWGATITSSADCVSWFQQRYDADKAQIDQDLQNRIDALSATPSSHDTTPLKEGEYDVYFLGRDIQNNTFQKDFPGGLVVDFTNPSATLTTSSAKDTVSPELNGTVDDPVAKVEVTLTGSDGKTYGPFIARNNGDGTWTIPAGTIQPGLVLGAYDVKITVTDLAGNTNTDNKTLTISASPKADNPNNSDTLSKTGVDVYMVVGVGVVMILIGAVVVVYRKFAGKKV